ncbi:MAG: rod-binding protein [Lachnospiraceae bacterium]|nr:rod-binding protein [Lachnospiraceae bacterium]
MELGNLSNASLATEFALQDAQRADIDKLRETAKRTSEAATDEELMSACKEFEAYLLEQVFKRMQKTVDFFKREGDNESADATGKLVDFFKDKTLQDLSKTSTETQGLGIAQMMYENMKNQANAVRPS